MPDDQDLNSALKALQRAHPKLDTLSALVLVALDRVAGEAALSTAQLARRLEIEHALIRRACAELETEGWVVIDPAAGPGPALRVRLNASLWL
ncbi:MarR family transcriptional regulator [Vreelandella sp. TE19]